MKMEKIELPSTGVIRPYERQLYILFKFFDAICIFGSLWFLCWGFQRSWSQQVLAAITAIALFHFFGELAKLYGSWRSESLIREFLSVCSVWLWVVFALLLLGYGFKVSADYSRLVIGTWFLLTPFILCLWRTGVRLLLRFIRGQGRNTRTVAVVGATDNGIRVAGVINRSPWMGLTLAGFFDDRAPAANRIAWSGIVEGNFEKLLDSARKGKIDVVYIALPLQATHRINQLLDRLSDTTASVYLVPEVMLVNLLQGQWGNLGTLPTISIFETPFNGLNGWFKRLQDIVLASIILVIMAIPMIAIAIGVKLSSPGSVLFKQRRYGLDGRQILVWKFRTMHVCEDGEAVRQATNGDPRVTRLGLFLRQTSLDELPQFINVLQGSMSIVGPRPHAVAHNETYRSLIRGYMLRHKVKPGITGWAQINGWRGETDTLEKMEQRIIRDLWYIRNWSLWLDLKIILLTILKGFYGKNAY